MHDEREFNNGELVPGTRYVVVSLVGTGGMGSVYEVEHCELSKRFVLKVLRRAFTSRDDLVQRLRTEWRALGRLEHRNIVSVTDAGVTAMGAPFYVMERLQGETLSARLRRQRRVPIPEALDIASQILDGLSAAHRIQVVHRDVKPPNVFLVEGGGVKLLDFGIAKITDPGASQITGRGVTLGTPRYMAPEQASGDPVGPHTDLYAVGLVLYEMIAGAGPFDAFTDSEGMYLAHLTRAAPSLRQSVPSVPEEVARIVAALLEKTVTNRPPSAEAAAQLLREVLASFAPASPEPHRSEHERTLPGGPFDDLEAADTALSGDARSPTGTLIVRGAAVTRTGLGEPPTERLEAWPESPVVEADDAPDSESVTRTAVPAAPDNPETPPPVERAAAGQRRVPTALAVALTGVGLVALAAGVYSASSWVIRSTRDTPPDQDARAKVVSAQPEPEESPLPEAPRAEARTPVPEKPGSRQASTVAESAAPSAEPPAPLPREGDPLARPQRALDPARAKPSRPPPARAARESKPPRPVSSKPARVPELPASPVSSQEPKRILPSSGL